LQKRTGKKGNDKKKSKTDGITKSEADPKTGLIGEEKRTSSEATKRGIKKKRKAERARHRRGGGEEVGKEPKKP